MTVPNPAITTLRERSIFALLAVVGALLITRGLTPAPNITDAFYHFNAAQRLVTGQGLTDPYLWVYVGAPDHLPAPSHLYWMPLTSLAAALGMGLLDVPGQYAAAQTPFALMLAGTAYIGFWLGGRLGGTRRHAWLAGLLTLTGGFFMRFWGATDTFAPYALIGSLCLLVMGLAVQRGRNGRQRFLLWALVGALAGLAHLTRADGVLLLMVAWAVIVWPFYRSAEQRREEPYATGRVAALAVVTLAYLVVMLPWFVRNLNDIGSPLPVGGTQSIWFREYDDLFDYPPTSTPASLFADGPGAFLKSRWDAFSSNLGTFVAVEGGIVLAGPMLVGLLHRRADPFLRGVWLYALGVHLAMTLVFPYPGLRGGLFHSAAALLPWWMALGLAGLDDLIDWAARRRRHWNRQVARRVFSTAVLLFVLALGLLTGLPRRPSVETPALYTRLTQILPPGARVMINDPAQLYYYTGLGGVVLPNEAPDVIPMIARRYDVDYLVLESETVNGQTVLAASARLASILTSPPDFLTEIDLNVAGARLYAITQ